MSKYTYHTQKQLRAAFRQMMIELNGIDHWRKLTHLDKKCYFVDWTDSLWKNGEISDALNESAYWQ